MDAYGYKQQIITDLNSIDNNSNNFYNYKNLNFLSKLNTQNENILIIFHGAVYGPDLIVFRGYDYTITNTDIICVSDFLLYKYKSKIFVNWTLTTKKHKSTDTIYKKLFQYIINMKNYKNVIFTGTSAGGFPSIKFASFFNATAIISNSQLYIENYVDNIGIKLINRILDDDDEVIYKDKMIENIILKSKPKQIIYYQNRKDIGPPHNAYNDFLQFKLFIEKNKLNDICEFKLFDHDGDIPEGKKHHHSITFPNNYKHINILSEFLSNN